MMWDMAFMFATFMLKIVEAITPEFSLPDSFVEATHDFWLSTQSWNEVVPVNDFVICLIIIILFNQIYYISKALLSFVGFLRGGSKLDL